ncbi:FAD-dependent monooxygenase [Tenacibaculum sp. UWU-22]|uniref:oxidoreductase n=1 Tax=Tenacibaculum sp. UWU-22 TaxID=3234187 RepID=UPI0034DB420A
MKITVIGGGPGGLYFSILTKKRIPNAQIDIYEQNKPDDAFGFGVVFSDETLSEFLSYDERSYELIRNSFAYWDDLDVVRDGEAVRIEGNGFCGCSRKTLLLLLQQRCKEEGINLHFETRIDDLSQFSNSDIIVAADGINSGIRKQYEKELGTEVTMMKNRFIWCGSTRPLDAFTYFFKNTKYGAFCAHTYQYEKGKSTWIFECSPETYEKAGFEEKNEETSVAILKELFKEELDGHDLITNRSWWRSFPHVYNKNWHYKNIVILGDAKATAHYSIGSGTKLAMDCAIGLSDAVVENPNNIQKAFDKYVNTRRNIVDMIQHAADVSLQWFENIDRHMKLDFDTFSFSTMSRSKKITIENQARRDKAYADRIIKNFNKKAGSKDLNTPPAFTPYSIGNVALPNRVVMSSMGQYNSEDGMPSDWDLVHYSSRAVGGVGLLFTGMAAISPEARLTPKDYGIWNDAQVAEWKKITDFIHANTDSKIGIEIGHAGRKGAVKPYQFNEPLTSGGWDLISADAIPFKTGFPTPKAMDVKDMENIKTQFVDAAKRGVKAGFDVIELQMHNGFLLASFLSPLTNQRKDDFGGAIENRAKYPLEVVTDIIKNIGETPLIVKLNVEDWSEGGITKEDVEYVSLQLKALGVAMIDVNTGNTVPNQNPRMGRMWQTPYSEWIKNSIDIPVITTGRIETIDQVNTVLLNHRADLVALGRTLLINPYFVLQSKAYEQYNTGNWEQAGIPQPYWAGAELYYIKSRKDREEFEDMKRKLKPKSHQNK